MLPDSAAVVELGGTWRPAATAIVLGAWAVIGLALAQPACSAGWPGSSPARASTSAVVRRWQRSYL